MPSWIGNVISPWLVAAWVAGAAQLSARSGALAGLALIGATVGGYVALAGADSGALWPRLAILAVLAGPAFGLAGTAWRRGGPGADVGLLLLGVAIFIESVFLWSHAASGLERVGIGLESILGIGLAVRAGWLAGRE